MMKNTIELDEIITFIENAENIEVRVLSSVSKYVISRGAKFNSPKIDITFPQYSIETEHMIVTYCEVEIYRSNDEEIFDKLLNTLKVSKKKIDDVEKEKIIKDFKLIARK